MKKKTKVLHKRNRNSMSVEYATILFAIFLVAIPYGASSVLAHTPLAFWTALISIFFGGFLIVFGFWGADYAMSVALGELDQSKQEGGEKGKVYVPFLRNYTPTEWWNLSWLITILGIFLAISEFLVVGILIG